MKIDRIKAEKVFRDYVSAYNAQDDKVRLKIEHTFRVAVLCEKIAASLGMAEDERDLAWFTGLLHDVGRYMGALDAYHAGDIEPMICCLVDALELAVVIGSRIAFDVDAVLDAWSAANTDRAGSASHDLPALLVEQPVVNVAYVAEHLEITDRAARSLVETACERGILSKMGNAKRGAFYQAGELIGILEEVSSLQGIRRIAAR